MTAPIQAKKKRRSVGDKPAECTRSGCNRPYFVSGHCHLHYTRNRRGRDMDAPARDHRSKPGDERVMRDGYVSVFAPGEPGTRSDGWIAVHRLVMQRHIGRALLDGENVHHRNGVRDDNRLENLELWRRTQPSGQRVSDLLAWAEEITQTYQPLRERNLI